MYLVYSDEDKKNILNKIENYCCENNNIIPTTKKLLAEFGVWKETLDSWMGYDFYDYLREKGFRCKKDILVNGKYKPSNEGTYEEMCILIQNFINKNKKFPLISEMIVANNLVPMKQFERMLKEKNISINKFKSLFINVEENRLFAKEDYHIYLDKYIDISLKLDKPLSSRRLLEYGLPNYEWYIENCDNTKVKTFNDFIEYEANFTKGYNISKEKTIEIIYNMQLKLKRPLCYDDFKNPNETEVGINTVRRYWRTMNKMKEELGLEITQEDMTCKHKTLNECKEDIFNICNYVYKTEGRKVVTYSDSKLMKNVVKFNTYDLLFKKYINKSLREYIESIGFELQQSGSGLNFTFDDGEKTISKYEYDFSIFLRNELGFIYGKDYFRDMKYREFVKDYKGKMNCDYIVKWNNGLIYIEIAGMLRDLNKQYINNISIDSYSKNEYRLKLMKKEKLLKDNNLKYYILFPINKNYEYVLDFDFIYKEIFNSYRANTGN